MLTLIDARPFLSDTLPFASTRTYQFLYEAIEGFEDLPIIEKLDVAGIIWHNKSDRERVPVELYDTESGLVYAEIFARVRRFLGCDRGAFNKAGFDKFGIHRKTLTRCDPGHYDVEGYHSYTGRNIRGFDRTRINRITCDMYDKRGFDFEGRHRNGTLFDEAGFDAHGRYGEKRARFDDDGYDYRGYNARGYARDGYNKRGYDERGRIQPGFTKGYRRDSTAYGPDGFSRSGFDDSGFDRDGYDADGWDRHDFARDGFNKKGIDKFGFDRARLYMGKRTFDNYGFSEAGIHAITGTRFDQNGFDRCAKHRETGTRFNPDNIDRDGFRYAWSEEHKCLVQVDPILEPDLPDVVDADGRFKSTRTPYHFAGTDQYGDYAPFCDEKHYSFEIPF